MLHKLTGYSLWEYQRRHWPYASRIMIRYTGEAEQARRWCGENIGVENINWIEWNQGTSSIFRFCTIEDLVFFDLVH